MTENRENWLYPDASGLYFPHDGFIMRATDGKQYDYEEECDLLNELNDENERLKQFTKQVLQNHLDGWRGVYNPIDESLVVEINVVKSIAEDLGVDLDD